MKTAKNRAQGFSMLELLAVMAIMGLLTTMGVTSYFSAIRGMSRRSAVKHFADTLATAQQRASIEGSSLSVVVFNEITGQNEEGDYTVSPSYVICKKLGLVTFRSGNTLVDEFTALNEIFGLEKDAGDPSKYNHADSRAIIRLYKLNGGGGISFIEPLVRQYDLRFVSLYDKGEPDNTFELNQYGMTLNDGNNPNSANWLVGDTYGVEAGPVLNLPKGFEFVELNDDPNGFRLFTFNPSGSGGKGGSVTIKELTSGRSVTVSVSGSSVSYGEW